MSNQTITIIQIRNSFLKSIACQFLPLFIIGLSEPWLELLPRSIPPVLSLFAIIAFFWGYFDCWMLAHRYAQYKGYSKKYGLLGILNILGLSILFLLKNKKSDDYYLEDKSPLINFSITAIFTSYFAIDILFTLLILAFILIGKQEFKSFEDFLENKNLLAIIGIPLQTLFAWYFFNELKRAKINLWHLVGDFKKIDFKLPIGLAILNYFFASGSSTMILYGLSFVVPKYVEGQINKVYATTPLGYTFFAIAVLIFAPIMEELFYRGIIFQKLAVTKDLVKGLLISALIFTIVHFRSDVISLFVIGLILALLYLKTKQIIVPIICHFVYNLIVTIRLIYSHFFSSVDPTKTISILEFRQEFISDLNWLILFIAISAPYLCYFIYKNFPRKYDVKKLPYFANQLTTKN